jgi:hypothetical protein
LGLRKKKQQLVQANVRVSKSIADWSPCSSALSWPVKPVRMVSRLYFRMFCLSDKKVPFMVQFL